MRLGADLSEHQRGIDLAGAGLDFVILRTTDGTYRDHAFAEHYANAASLDIAAYHFLRAPSEGTTVAEQVDAALEVLGGMRVPMWLDVESPAGLSLDDVTTAHHLFHTAGVEVAGVYTTARYWRRHMFFADVAQFGALWLAEWRDNPPHAPGEPLPPGWPRPLGFPQPALWQFTSRGRVSGPGGRIDVDLNLAR